MADQQTQIHVAGEPVPEAGGRLLLGWLLILIAVVLLIAGWAGVSASPEVAVQLAYLASGGLGGLLAGIIGVGLLVSDDVRKDRDRLGRLEASVLEMRDLLSAQTETIERLTAEPRRSKAAR